MKTLQAKTTRQLFEATVNLEFDYFINMLPENISIADFGKRVSIEDTSNNGMAFYFDNHCIFRVTPPTPEDSRQPPPLVERFYLDQQQLSTTTIQ